MKRKRIWAMVMACSLIFSNISWAAEDLTVSRGLNMEAGKTEAVRDAKGDFSRKATDSDADAGHFETATASNSFLKNVKQSEFPVSLELYGDPEEPVIYSGRHFNYRLKADERLADGEEFQVVVRDGNGKQMRSNRRLAAEDFREPLVSGSTGFDLPAGNYSMRAEDETGNALSNTVPVKICRGDYCKAELYSALVKPYGLGDKDCEPEIKASLRNGQTVVLCDAQLIRQPGEDAGEYEITGIRCPDYDTVELEPTEYNKLVIEKRKDYTPSLGVIKAGQLTETEFDAAKHFPEEAKITGVTVEPVNEADRAWFAADPVADGTKVRFILNAFSSADTGKMIQIPVIIKSKNYEDCRGTISIRLEKSEAGMTMKIAPVDGSEERPLDAYNGYKARILVFGHAECENTRAVSKTVNELVDQYEGYVKGFLFDTDQELPVTKEFADQIGDMVVCNQKDSGNDYQGWEHILLKQVEKEEEAMTLPAVFLIDQPGDIAWCSPSGVVSKETIVAELKKVGVKSASERAADIKAFKTAHPFETSRSAAYKTAPDMSRWLEGELSEESVQNGLNALNFARYIADIPADVTNNKEYQMYAQKGSMMIYKLGHLDHTPKNPGLPEDFYRDAYEGTSRSNLHQGYSNLAATVIGNNSYLDDGDSSNIDRAGHRRWCLNPAMKEAGFGMYKGFNAFYASDESGDSLPYYVPWPARVMPYQYFDGPWSISFDSEKYDMYSSQDEITVTMSDGKKTYTFGKDRKDGYFNVDTEGFGSGPAVIFKPASGFGSNARVEVTVSGVRDYDGFEQDIHYVVQFFSMSGSSSTGGGGGSSSGGGGGGGSSSGGGGGTSKKVTTSQTAGSTALPDYVIKGNWTTAADGSWKFTDASGTPYINRWAAVENPYANTALGQQAFDWFFFDGAGNMMTGWYKEGDGSLYYLNPESDGSRGKMVTGWVWIPDQTGVKKCYYFNPNSDGYRGKLMTNTVIDGSTVNTTGEWVVDGVVQTQ